MKVGVNWGWREREMVADDDRCARDNLDIRETTRHYKLLYPGPGWRISCS